MVVTLAGKRDFADVITVIDLNINYPGLFGGLD